MASKSVDPSNFDDARVLLHEVEGDRARVGQLVRKETWWGAPAQGLGAALLVASPLGGLRWGWVLIVGSFAVFIAVEVLFRKRTGLRVSYPAGPAGLAILIALGVGIALAAVVSTVWALIGATAAVVMLSLFAGVVTAGCVVAYDVLYVRELRNVG